MLLGPVRVRTSDGGIHVPPGAPTRALIAALAVGAQVGEPRSIAALADDVWGDSPPQNPRAALQSLVSRLRAVAGSELVRSSPAGYALGTADVDLTLADALSRRADELDPAHPDRLALIDEALALWLGEPAADLGDAPVAESISTLAGRVHERLRRARAETLIASGRHSEAAAELQLLAAARPFDEAVHMQLMSALAHAGRAQEAIAVFASVRQRLRDELGTSPGAELTALHTRLLRGDASPTTSRVRIGLRTAPNELIGRDADIAAVAAMLSRARLVTILGAGGLGKTRLAQATAAASAAPSVIVVELASVRADDDVPLAIASELGISEAAPGGRFVDARSRPDLRARVVSLLGERETLLVLDNCEQVIDGVAAWTSDMLESAPTLRVLTTSRTPLAITAESVYPLEPLATVADEAAAATGAAAGPAVRLFIERATAVRPAAALPLDVVARLCEHLDGLPLAIELAAARVRTMTPEQIESRLRDRFALLTAGDRTAPERHRTLEAVIAWSWDLLDAEARSALARLSILPGGFSAATAAAVLGDGDADDALDRLASQSLLVVVDDPITSRVRFRMLETVREFGLARLREARAADAAWAGAFRWARMFAAERVTNVFEVAVFREIRAEHDNLIAVLRRAVERDEATEAVAVFSILSQAWFMRGAFSEFQTFGPIVLPLVDRVTSADVSVDVLALVLLMSVITMQIGEGSARPRVVARLRILRRRHTDLATMTAALIDVAGAGTSERALAEIARLRASSDLEEALVGEMLMAQFAENEGEPAVAMAAAERAWELADRTDRLWLASMAANAVGQLASQSARPAEALDWLDRAARGLAEFGADEELHQQRWFIGGNLVGLGRFDEARALFTQLTTIRELTNDGLELASIGWIGLAEVDRADGDTAAAARSYEHALDTFATNDQRNSPWYLMAMAGLVSATTFDGSLPPERIAVWARRLRSRALATRRIRSDFIDKPVLGTVLAGWSAWALSEPSTRDRGIEALALAEVLGARQDLRSLHLDTHRSEAEQIVGAQAIADAWAAASALPRETLAGRAFDVLSDPATA
ncbi:Predicted ATPase [Microbacterium sp. cf046]|nr:Predicted ATPase [Microbacterium sp. cf046]